MVDVERWLSYKGTCHVILLAKLHDMYLYKTDNFFHINHCLKSVSKVALLHRFYCTFYAGREYIFYLFPDGRITTLANFDFETAAVTTCTVTVLVNDGKMFSDPDIVTLEITNVDEPPNFSNTLYKITTPEVVVSILQ